MAAGKVATGFSKPYVALYNVSEGGVSYSGARALARGVGVSLEPETSDDNIFYADNQAAETEGGVFKGGKVTLTVDGLKEDAEAMIYGTASADEDGWTAYGDNQRIPYVGIGYVTRYMEDGVVSYVPTVLAKAKFAQKSESAKTQEENIDFQTQELSATLMRADDANHNWKYLGKSCATEAEAEALLVAKLS